MCEVIANPMEPVYAFQLALETPDPSRLGGHVPNFELFQILNLLPVLSEVRQLPSVPMLIQKTTAFTFDQWEQNGNLRCPDTLAGVVSISKYPTDGLLGEARGAEQVSAGKFGDERTLERDVCRIVPGTATAALEEYTTV